MLPIFNRPFTQKTTAQSAALGYFGLQLGYLGDDNGASGAYPVITGVNFAEPESYDSWTNPNSPWLLNIQYWKVKDANYNPNNVPALATRAQKVAAGLQAVIDEGGANSEAAQATLDKYQPALSALAQKVDDNVRARANVATAGTITDAATAGATSSLNAGARDQLDAIRTQLLNAINTSLEQLANEPVPQTDAAVADKLARMKLKVGARGQGKADMMQRGAAAARAASIAANPPKFSLRQNPNINQSMLDRVTAIPGLAPPKGTMVQLNPNGSMSRYGLLRPAASDSGADTGSSNQAATAESTIPWGMIAVGVGGVGLLALILASGKK